MSQTLTCPHCEQTLNVEIRHLSTIKNNKIGSTVTITVTKEKEDDR